MMLLPEIMSQLHNILFHTLDDIASAYENVATGNIRFRALTKTHLETLYLALSILSGCILDV